MLILSVNPLPVSNRSILLQIPFTIPPIQHNTPQTITIFHNGKPITWQPRDQIPPPTYTPVSPPTSAPTSTPTTSAAETEPEVSPLKDPKTRRRTKLKARLKKGFMKLLPQVTKQKHATKIFNTGVNTFSSGKHSFVNRFKFWKLRHKKSFESPCGGCRSWNGRLDPDARNPLCAGDDLNMNQLGAPPSVDQERDASKRLERMVTPSEMSIPRSLPIPIPGAKRSSRGCCSRRGKANQNDGNVGFHVKNAAFPNTKLMPGDIIHVTIDEKPGLSLRHFAKAEESLLEDGQLPSPVRECFPIDEENMTELELSPVGLDCTGFLPDIVQVPRDVESPVSFEIAYPPGVDLEVALKEAMESSLPCTKIEAGKSHSPTASTSETAEQKADGSTTSLNKSFSRTPSPISSIDGHSAPSNSFFIEGPYSHLGSDFVDVEDYLKLQRTSPSPPTYSELDRSATTEDFGFTPTYEHLPGSSPEEVTSQEILTNKLVSLKGQENPTLQTIRLLDFDSEDPPSFDKSQKEVLETWAQYTRKEPDTIYSFSKCRPIPSTIQDGSLAPPLSPKSTDSNPTSSLHLRGGGDEPRFSLFRSVGRGKLVGNAERGRMLLNEPVSGTYMIGSWGRNETWKEFGVKMERRVAKRKQLAKIDEEIEKLKAEKENAGGKGLFGEAVANVKGWFVSGKGEEETEELVVTGAEQRTRMAD
ncbi:hypothetical protein N431DRAFT_501697 [Stipitochalara longipes BDJ]|nr:hypothetical protein N431DRAFT_501697 [Stipitochalara longipes BDJ]